MSDAALIELMAREMCRVNSDNPDDRIYYGPPMMGPKNTYIAPDVEPRPLWEAYYYECSRLLQLVDEYRRDNPAE